MVSLLVYLSSDSAGVVFGALITENIRIDNDGEKYYGNGLMTVWSFESGVIVVMNSLCRILVRTSRSFVNISYYKLDVRKHRYQQQLHRHHD
jgi:hypothetical protein